MVLVGGPETVVWDAFAVVATDGVVVDGVGLEAVWLVPPPSSLQLASRRRSTTARAAAAQEEGVDL